MVAFIMVNNEATISFMAYMWWREQSRIILASLVSTPMQARKVNISGQFPQRKLDDRMQSLYIHTISLHDKRASTM